MSDTQHTPAPVPDDAPDAPETPDAAVARLTAERDDMRDRWLRAEAEMANVRARAKRDMDDTRQYAVQKFAADVVEAADNLRRGLISGGGLQELIDSGVRGLTSNPAIFEEAIARSGDYDAVVLDVMLPGQSGYRVVQALRAERVWVPVLMLTAKDGEHDEADALDVGADDYLTKPFSFVVLVARLRALLRRGAPRRPAVLSAGGNVLDEALPIAPDADPAATDVTGVTDPRLGALADNGGPTGTLLPATGSPVIDAGITFSTDDMDAIGGPSLLLDADQRGVAVLSQVDGARWLSLEGSSTVSAEPEAVRDAELRYAQRYRTPRVNPRRVVIEVRIERVLGSSDLLDRSQDD